MKLGAWYQGVTWEMSRAEAGIHVSGLQDEDNGFGSSLDPMGSDGDDFMFNLESCPVTGMDHSTLPGNIYNPGFDDD